VVAWKQIQNRKVEKEGRISEEGTDAEVQTHLRAALSSTIYYAFKQSETQSDVGTASTGWETFLDAVIQSGLAISGTWPMRTEMTAALKDLTNSLASSIILVCRPRVSEATTVTRRDFLAARVCQ
jgi:putative DNA methylase